MRIDVKVRALARVVTTRRFPLTLARVLVTSLAVACSDSQGPTVTGTGPSPFLVSSPVPDLAASRGLGTSRLASASFAQALVYVSLPPGAIPNGVTASIRNLRTGNSVTALVVDGGFDPVALPAVAGDTLAIAVQAIGAGPTSYQSVVAAATRPSVVRTSPPPNKRDVSLNSIVVIVFSEPLDSATVDTGSVQLWRGTTPVAGTVRFADAAHLRVEFHPDSLLVLSTDYQFIVTTAIKDLNGLALDSAVTVPFTTTTVAIPPATNLVFASVSVGYVYTCGVTTAGVAYCWGRNTAGALGTGAVDDGSLSPMPVSGGLTFASVSASFFHTCGVTTSGAAYCWGTGGIGNPIGYSPTPVPVAGGLTFKSVSAGLVHTCGVTTAGSAYCWGENLEGELGAGTAANGSVTPVLVAGGLTFAAVSAGAFHTCGVTTSGTAYCWGRNNLGQLGIGTSTGPEQCLNGTSYACSTVPVAVAGGLTFATLSSAYEGYPACGATTAGVAYCWGANWDGLIDNHGTNPGPEQCSDDGGGTFFTSCSTVPDSVPDAPKLAWLSAGHSDAGGLTSAGVAYCWGYCGIVNTWFAVGRGLTFATLSVGYTTACGVTTAGVAYCWGYNSEGEFGDGTTSSSAVPVKVAGQP